MTNNSPYKVVSYHVAPYGESQLGFATVLIKNSVRVIFKVCKTKIENLFVCPVSTKIDGAWTNTFGYVDKDMDRAMMNAVLEQVKPMVVAAAKPMQQQQMQQPQPKYVDDGVPF